MTVFRRVIRSRATPAGALGAFVCAAAFGLPSGAVGGDPAPQQTLHVAQSGLGAEKVKTVPISRRRGQKAKVVMSLPPGKVGDTSQGDTVWAGAEFEISVTCLEPIPQCVGKIYHYSPSYRARLVLTDGAKVTSEKPTKVMAITKWRRQTCSQDLPHRNHHCVMALSGFQRIKETPVCQRCYVNLVVDAYHRNAKKGNVVVVGTDEDNGIKQDKGMIHSGIFSPGPQPDIEPLITPSRSRSKLSIAGPGRTGSKEVIYSQRINPDILKGEQLIVEAQATQRIGHHNYSVLMQSQLIVSDSPNSTRRNGVSAKVTKLGGILGAQNGFNCTQGRSGHSDPCKIRKVGLVEFTKDAVEKPLSSNPSPSVPLFINLVAQNREIGVRGGWRSGDSAKIAKKGGYIKVHRYPAEMHKP